MTGLPIRSEMRMEHWVNGASTLNGQLVLANNGIDTDPQTGQYVCAS